jgi:hypothetical protein
MTGDECSCAACRRDAEPPEWKPEPYVSDYERGVRAAYEVCCSVYWAAQKAEVEDRDVSSRRLRARVADGAFQCVQALKKLTSPSEGEVDYERGFRVGFEEGRKGEQPSPPNPWPVTYRGMTVDLSKVDPNELARMFSTGEAQYARPRD